MVKHPFRPGPLYWDYRCLTCGETKRRGFHTRWQDMILQGFLIGFALAAVVGAGLTLLIIAGVRF